MRKRREPVFGLERGSGPQELERRGRPVIPGVGRGSTHSTKRHLPIIRTILLIGLVVWAGYKLNQFFFVSDDAKLINSVAQSPTFVPTSQLDALNPALDPRTVGHVLYSVRSGDTWASITNSLGLVMPVAQEINSVLQNYAREMERSLNLGVGEDIDFTFDPERGLTDITIRKRSNERLVLTKNDNASFDVAMIKEEYLPRDHVLIGEITKDNSSFASAAQAAGVSYDVVDSLVDLLSDRIRFRQDFRIGDRFTVIFSEPGTAGGTDILAARVDVSNATNMAIRFVGSDGKPRYFDGEGKLLGNTFLRYPLKFSRISSEFTTARFHPILKRKRPHNGVDFAAPTGTPVRSVANGQVIFAGRKGGNGLMISIKHSDRYQTVYCHLSKIDKSVRKRGLVARGQVIGAVGSTGLATGPHLHFGFFEKGKYVDPLRIKLPTVDTLDRNQRISDSYLQRVLFTLEHYQKLERSKVYISG